MGLDMMLMSALLPLPPSTNGLFAGKGRRYKAPKYVEWIKSASLKLRNEPKIKERVHINYTIFLKDGRGGDISNRIKACEDLLVSRGILPDDSHEWIRSFWVGFGGYDKSFPHISIEVHQA